MKRCLALRFIQRLRWEMWDNSRRKNDFYTAYAHGDAHGSDGD